jgi:DNA-binding transcriptional ArsR family regulator
MGAAFGTLTEIRELKTEISGLRTDLKRFIEHANQQHVATVLGDLRKNYAGLFSDHQVENAKTDLSAHMVGECGMREKCYQVFMNFLQTTSKHIREGEVSDEIIQSYREQIKALRAKGSSDRCDTCFTEVYRLFEKQVDLMQSLGIYQKPGENIPDQPGTTDESVVKNILEPVANVQRFQILKALSAQTRTFSDLSGITGLKGGNLLFHIRKLLDCGLILQRHERGDYIITDRGYKTMTAIAELHRQVTHS